jgi:NAD(P)-dependent dehydrogenase (short-subunit alcohol dehydrogenase family)
VSAGPAGRLEGRVALVTGSSSGIGRAIALLFAAEGAQVVCADRAEEPVEGGRPTHQLIADRGGRCSFEIVDLADAAAVERLGTGVAASFGRFDVLVANAATYVGKPLLETTEEEWRHVFDVNVTAVFLLSRIAVRQMLTQPPVGPGGVRGRIVNVSSQHGMTAAPLDIAYGTSKSAIAYMTRQIAVDYGARGIVVNAVAPGKIVTGKGGREDDPEWQEHWLSRTPIGRLGEPDDVARAALFLAGDDSTFLTGVNLMVDGGWSAA